MQEFEKPDWSLVSLEDRDLAWAEGNLKDGRPFFLEHWRDGQTELATVYFSNQNLIDSSIEFLFYLLLASNLVSIEQEPLPIDAGEVIDSAGQKLVSLNFVLSDSSEKYATLKIPLQEFFGR